MTLRRALIAATVAGGTILTTAVPAFAGTEVTETLPDTGSNGSDAALATGGTLLVAGAVLAITSSVIVAMRRRNAHA